MPVIVAIVCLLLVLENADRVWRPQVRLSIVFSRDAKYKILSHSIQARKV